MQIYNLICLLSNMHNLSHQSMIYGYWDLNQYL